MANWNLSVDLTARGSSLARALRESAQHARSLERAARSAKREVRELGAASRTATAGIRTLGREARQAARHLNSLGNNARTSARQLGRYGDAARTANRHLNSLGSNSRQAGAQLRGMNAQITAAIRDLTRLAAAARTASTHMNRVGNTRALRGIARDTRSARGELHRMAALLSGGGLTMGFAGLVKNGNEYQQAMNSFGAVTGATQIQMQRAALTAAQLGSDLSLPNASATEAAQSMVELAKAGFRTDQAISATRASLQLASAAQVSAADSAKYLGDMMDQFGMGADQAGTAADTLAATANAASGDIIDIYYAMKYAGPMAHHLGVTMSEAASAVGMLGKAGILGQTAGTSLRAMFTNLAKPTPMMVEGLHAMGIEAWDAQGRFKGLRYMVEKLQVASHKLSQKDFTAAVTKAFGKPAVQGMTALAHQGLESYDALIGSVTDVGAAADIAAAKGKGLAGAMTQLKTQSKQTGLAIYDGMAPGLEFLTRGITSAMSKATPKITKFFDYLNASAVLFGPDLAAAAKREFGGIADAVRDMGSGFKDFGADAVATALHLIITAAKLAAQVLSNLADGVEPVVSALSDVTSGSSGAATAMDMLVMILDAAATTIGTLSTVLGPIGHLVGGLVSAFGALPGPIQSAVFALLLFRRVQPALTNMAANVRGPVTRAFQSLNQQMTVQRSLAAASGVSLTRYGAAMAVLQARSTTIGAMGAAFRSASAAGTGFTSTLRGVAAAAGAGARSLGSGLVNALGGPWGVAIAAASVGLGMYANQQQKAAQAAAEHKAQVDALTGALQQSNGQIDESVRQTAAQTIQQAKFNTTLGGNKESLIKLLNKEGYSLDEVTDAYLGQGASIDDLSVKIGKLAKHKGGKYLWASIALKQLGEDAGTAKKNAKDLTDAIDKNKGVSAYDQLKDAVGALADKTADADSRTRALRQSLDLLSGGSVSLQAAEARVNEAITQANDAMAEGVDRSKGWGKALLGANGVLDTATKNGQDLFNTLNGLTDASGTAAIAAYDFAQSQGKDLPTSLEAARAEMQKSRDAAVKLAQNYGLTRTQAEGVADSLGLIPDQVSILLQAKGLDSTLAELLAVQAEFERVPDKKTIKVDALSEGAKKKLEEIGITAKLIPGTREYKLTAKTDAAKQALADFLRQEGAVKDKKVKLTAETKAAIKDLQNVQAKVRDTKGKTITMRAPTAEARKQLEALGFKIRSVPGSKNVTITIPTGTPRSQAAAIQSAINSLRGKQVAISVVATGIGAARAAISALGGFGGFGKANGGIVDYYANGGIQRGGVRRFAGGAENHVAQIAPAGSWRVWAEPETDGEGYVPFARSKRGRSRAITEEIVRRLGGDPSAITWQANGGVIGPKRFADGGMDFSYSGTGGSANRYTLSGLISASQNSKGNFDLGKFIGKLRGANNALDSWRANLARVASRAGQDVADALAEMGDDGIDLTRRMAYGSTKYVKDMAAQLRNLAASAKASLGEYTSQLKGAVKDQTAFQDDLAKLAAMGFGDLAGRLAAQGDADAAAIAHQAAKDKKKAASANSAAKSANNALSADQLAQLVQIIAAVTSSKVGIHQVADKTGLGEDEIIAVATKAKTQISKALGSRGTQFLSDLARAQKGMAYANGGIRAGLYATRNGLVRFAEPETGGEAYIPLGLNKRGAATNVLSDVAHRFGLGITPAGDGGRVVVIREQGPLVGQQTWHVTSGGSAADTARRIDADNSYQLRRLARGGVGAR
ncbi:phage tail tape measure protein [Streptomyces sp. ME19-01-6]|uniref:phage tail tape measure protein n=1 Tax=Streptomyces sp. ME19-01-6 TaxID=3028686 RepID=UPI0029A9E4A4|nr:phage tail tape measure protein [Streptomyces sp. ME19-01-6]MDX3232894.1 phage tail tape measure protein [Streptomyces sp. ME19-01-6]